jgi:protein transport protein SEC31
MPVFEILNNEMERIKSKAPAAFKAQVLDTEKRLSILFDSLNNDLLKGKIEDLKQVALAIQAREHDQANALLQKLITDAASQDDSKWMVSSVFPSQEIEADKICRLA